METIRLTPENCKTMRIYRTRQNIDVFDKFADKDSSYISMHGIKFIQIKKLSRESGIKMQRRDNKETKTHYYKLSLYNNVVLFTNDYPNKKENE